MPPQMRRNTQAPAFMSHEELKRIDSNIRNAIKYTRTDMLRLGFIKVEDLDDEELRVGRCRNEQGTINIREHDQAPMPREMHDAMIAEFNRRNNDYIRQQQLDAINTMLEIMNDPTVEPRDRFEAAKYMFERSAGKTPDKQTITVQRQPWEEVFDGIAQVTQQQSKALSQPTIDAEVVPDPSAPNTPAPSVNPYGHIQGPNAPGYGGATPQAAAAPDLPINPKDVEPPPTIPPEAFAPAKPQLYRVPGYEDPVTTSSTAPPAEYWANNHPDQTPEVQSPTIHGTGDNPTVQLSEMLRQQQEQAKERAAMRKAGRKIRIDAKKRRAIARNMGFDGTDRNDIKATIEPNEDGTETMRFTIESPG